MAHAATITTAVTRTIARTLGPGAMRGPRATDEDRSPGAVSIASRVVDRARRPSVTHAIYEIMRVARALSRSSPPSALRRATHTWRSHPLCVEAALQCLAHSG